MKVVYVAAPYRAATTWAVEMNIHRAKRAALEVWHAGALELMRRCDAVYVPDPRNVSAGMAAEIREAESRGMPVLNGFVEMIDWVAAPWSR